MKKLLCIISLIPFCFFGNCSAQEQGNGKAGTAVPQRISAIEAKAMMDEDKPYILVDVRTEDEYKMIRLIGAILIPVNEIASRAEKELPDKNAVILIYCRSGVRSAGAAQALAGMGYTNIYDMGGIVSWPYETVSDYN